MNKINFRIAILGLIFASVAQTSVYGFGRLPSITYASIVWMTPYKNLGGNSGVTGYEIGSDWIIVEFNGYSQYLYNYRSTGQINIEQMKQLAIKGQGLNTFINKYVRKNYAAKLK